MYSASSCFGVVGEYEMQMNIEEDNFNPNCCWIQKACEISLFSVFLLSPVSQEGKELEDSG